MEDYPRLVFHGQTNKKDEKSRRWLFGPKDVIILTCIAFSISGLMGLGGIMIVDFIDNVIYLS